MPAIKWLLPVGRWGTADVAPGVADKGEGRQAIAVVGPATSLRMTALHVFVLASFAITEPIYSLLGERTIYLADLGVGLRTILWLTAGLSVLLPGILAAGHWGLSRLMPRAASGLNAVVIFLLLALVALPALKRAVLLPGWMLIGLSLAAAAGAAYAYFAFKPVRSIVTVCTPAILVFPTVLLMRLPLGESASPKPSAGETNGGGGAPVVLVVFDEFCGMTLMNEAGEIDGDRFPHFAELAREATWFRNATTVGATTAQVVPAILSGKNPTVMGSGPSLDNLPQNLFTILQADQGYELAAFEPLSRLAPEKMPASAATTAEALEQVSTMAPTLFSAYLYFLSPTDFREELPSLPPLWYGMRESIHIDRQLRRGVFRYSWGEDRRGQFEHFLDCLAEPSDSTLYFIHDVLPHVNWCYLPSGRMYIPDGSALEKLDFNTRDSMAGFWGADELFVEHCQQRYLLQVGFVDSLVGRLLTRLKETGLYDKCLLIVTGDHGLCFKPKQSRRGITPDNAADILSVPLFIKVPGQTAGAISDRNVQSIDILPTIADVLRLDPTAPFDGRSVFDQALPEKTEKTIFDAELVARTYPASILEGSTVPADLRMRFGPSDDPAALFRVGPFPKLVGRAVDSLPISDEPPVEIELLRSGTDYSEDRNALVPCYVEGRIVAPSGKKPTETVAIAVAVNGTIRTVTRALPAKRLARQMDGHDSRVGVSDRSERRSVLRGERRIARSPTGALPVVSQARARPKMTQPMTAELKYETGSYRDREGRIFYGDAGEVYRALSPGALAEWQAVSTTHFFSDAMAAGKIVRSEQVAGGAAEFALPDDDWAAVAGEREAIPAVPVSYRYDGTFAGMVLLGFRSLAAQVCAGPRWSRR